MFGLLKKKIGEFIGKLTSKEEEKADEKNADITSPTLTSGVSTSQKSNSGAFSQPVISEPTSLTSKGTDENLREKMHSVQNAPEPRVPSLEIPSLKPEAESPATRPRLFDVEKKPFPSPKTSPENSAVGAPATAEKKEVPER
ncbi:MAG TPA: hypothetical protein VI874_01235, partial [Candidatus Norongarragalinales archaeon]|nr:hypothetical protein [Candidatus Norongarragalinales archaeon]